MAWKAASTDVAGGCAEPEYSDQVFASTLPTSEVFVLARVVAALRLSMMQPSGAALQNEWNDLDDLAQINLSRKELQLTEITR